MVLKRCYETPLRIVFDVFNLLDDSGYVIVTGKKSSKHSDSEMVPETSNGRRIAPPKDGTEHDKDGASDQKLMDLKLCADTEKDQILYQNTDELSKTSKANGIFRV